MDTPIYRSLVGFGALGELIAGFFHSTIWLCLPLPVFAVYFLWCFVLNAMSRSKYAPAGSEILYAWVAEMPGVIAATMVFGTLALSASFALGWAASRLF